MPRTEHRIAEEPAIKRRRIRFGRIAKKLRTEAGLTLKTLAESVGCSMQQISDIENAHVSPSFALREKLAAVLNGGRDLLCE